jgi:hypothetical protein
MYGEGLSIEDVIVEEPETLLKSELVLAGTDDENLPELVAARTSDRFGAYTTLDNRIEATEARTAFWFWIGADPEFTINLAGTSIAHQAVSISYEGTVYTIGASSFVITAAAGFIKATLSGGVITFSVINATTFDPDTDLSATSVIVGAWHNASKTVYTLQGSINEVITARGSARLGAQVHLDDRLEAIEARLNQWAWNDTDPDFRLQASNTIGHSTISISYNGSTYTLTAGTFSRSGTEGFIRARLENATVVLSSINSANFNPDTDLTAGTGAITSPVDIIVGSWESVTNIVHTRQLGGDVVMTREGDEIVGDGVLTGFGVNQQGSPDNTVVVDGGTAIVAGHKVRAGATQTLTTTNFTAAAVNRIDVVVLDNFGVASLVTGTESATPVIPAVPSDTVILAYLYLRSSGIASPPEDIVNNNGGAGTSFILLNLQRSFVQRDDTDPHRHPANIAIDGAFLRSSALTDWTPTTGTFVQSSAQKIFGDFSGLFTPVTTAKVEQIVADISPLLGKWVTLSAYERLAAVNTTTGRITIVVTGGTDSSVSFAINNVLWQRGNITGFISPLATAVTIRLELDTTASNTTAGYFDGVQLSVGKILTEFEYPTRVFVNKDGSIDLPNSVLSGDVVINGSLTVTGAEDTEAAFLAWIAQ